MRPSFYLQLTILFVVTGGAFCACNGKSKPFTPLGDKFLLNNPERGYYHHREVTLRSYKPIASSEIQKWNKENVTLVLLIFVLEPYVATDLTKDVTDNMANEFKTLRSAGMKSIVRFSYSQSEKNMEDAKLNQLLNHIKQVKKVLTENVDVITSVQIGFVGVWGEWYYSNNYATKKGKDWYEPTKAQQDDRNTIVKALINAVPSSRMLQIRYPSAKQILCGQANLNPTKAFDSTNMCSRLGLHNDCFMATDRDRGTFDQGKEASQRKWLEIEGQYTIVGGETCQKNKDTGCPNAKVQIAKQRFTYLNLDYDKTVIQSWVDDGCYKTVGNNMGYRFELVDGVIPTTAQKGSQFCASLNIKNSGVAPLYNERPMEVILREKKSGKQTVLPQKISPRSFAPGKTTAVELSGSIPSGLATGTYDIILNLPDSSPALRTNPKYNILFANGGGVQEKNTRFNILGQVLIQ